MRCRRGIILLETLLTLLLLLALVGTLVLYRTAKVNEGAIKSRTEALYIAEEALEKTLAGQNCSSRDGYQVDCKITNGEVRQIEVTVTWEIDGRQENITLKRYARGTI